MKREPRKWKYKRTFNYKNKVESLEPGLSYLYNSKYGLVVMEDTFLYYNQLFTLYRLLKKNFKKNCYLKINVSCVLPYTKKPVSARMGKGKGAWKGFKGFIRKGSFLLELGEVSEKQMQIVLDQCSRRLPVKVKKIKIKL